MKKAKSFLKKDNVTEAIVLTCLEFSKITKIPREHHHSYALALAYTLSNELAIEDGSSAEEIDMEKLKDQFDQISRKHDTLFKRLSDD